MFIFAHRRTLTLLDGEYGSVFKGRSLDFDELRAYVPGDEVRDIDWKATARHGSPLVKRYVAVRRHTVLLLVDTGRNMAAQALSGESKKDVAVHAAGVLGYLASRHGDDVALLHGNATESTYRPPRSGEEHLERLLRDVDAGATLESPASGIAEQLDYVVRYLKGRMLIVAIADEFIPDARTQNLMRRLRGRHEVLWLTVRDAELVGDSGHQEQDSTDVANGQGIPLPVSVDATVKAAYAAATLAREQHRQDIFHRLGIAEEQTTGTENVLTSVFALLDKHRSRAFTTRNSPRSAHAG